MTIASPLTRRSEGHRLRPPAATPLATPLAARPIVAAVEPETARITAATAARLARELHAPLTFVTVRPGISPALRESCYERRLTRDMWRGRQAIDAALAEATRHDVMAHGEIVEGDAASCILRFAGDRRARVLVVGRRAGRPRRSVSRRVTAGADCPVVVAAAPRARRLHGDPSPAELRPGDGADAASTPSRPPPSVTRLCAATGEKEEER